MQTCSFSWVALACALQLSAGAAIRRALCGREAQLLRAWARPLCSPPELAPAAPVLLCGRLPSCCSAPLQTQRCLATRAYCSRRNKRLPALPRRACGRRPSEHCARPLPCCWDAAPTGTASLALLAQCSPTCTHKNRERDQTNPKRASELNQNRPLQGQEEGRASIPSESMVQGLKFPSQNPNPRGEEGGRKNRTGRGAPTPENRKEGF